jgi:hypothetical protein
MAAAHTAVLELEGAKAQIIDLGYSFARATDPEKGQPTKVVRAGTISVTIRSDEKEMNGKVIAWMHQQDLPKEGKITIFKDADQTKEFKVIEFKNAYVTGYNESFNSQGSTANTIESFDISAEQITVAGNAFNMRWPDTE